jgi:hypothetical protein
MKLILSMVVASLLLISSGMAAGMDEVVTAVKSGNAAQVAKYFDKTVEISILDRSNSYSASQGEMVLKDFFALNPVKGFEVIHKGKTNNAEFVIGKLSSKGRSFRFTVYVQQKDGRSVIQEIRIEAE